MDTIPDLERLQTDALSAATAATSAKELRAVEKQYLAKGGVVAGLLASIPGLPPEQRKATGQGANRIKAALLEALDARRAELERASLEAELAGGSFDPTLPGAPAERGSLHPINRSIRLLDRIFSGMGWTVLDGPEVERDWYNFGALNIPADHPARDMYDTLWCAELPSLATADGSPGSDKGGLLMRTHTSPVQVRAMEQFEPPFRAIVPGRCFRQETVDASHDHTFHQMEGLAVDEGLTVGHLIGTMRTFLREVFGREIEVRLRPGYFPFVEPGFELDARCPFCEGGCSVCKGGTWIELCPCGMVHPEVLRAGGIDPERYTGFAFGLGLSRLVMLRRGIDDIRHILGGDVRFLEQF